jgi:hypothetical protein
MGTDQCPAHTATRGTLIPPRLMGLMADEFMQHVTRKPNPKGRRVCHQEHNWPTLTRELRQKGQEETLAACAIGYI